ncbi:MAG: hypothetical protein GY944_12630 [bacterium]|nr:hypothetical protein [bacterium]
MRVGGVPGSPRGVISLFDDHVMWSGWNDSKRISHGSIASAGSVFYELADVPIIGFRADHTDMVWKQCNDVACTSRDLWTARYVRDPIELEPRLIVRDEVVTGSFLGGGLLAFDLRGVTPIRDVGLVRLADGSITHYLLENVTTRDGIYVTNEEVAVSAVRLEGRRNGTLIRLDVDAFVEVE